MAQKGSMTHCCERCECTSRNNRTHIHTAQTHFGIHTTSSLACHSQQCVCVHRQGWVGWRGVGGLSQRADGVNGRVNCVSGGPRGDVVLPPGYTKRLRPTCSQTRTYTCTLRGEKKKKHNQNAMMQNLRRKFGHGEKPSKKERLDWN